MVYLLEEFYLFVLNNVYFCFLCTINLGPELAYKYQVTSITEDVFLRYLLAPLIFISQDFPMEKLFSKIVCFGEGKCCDKQSKTKVVFRPFAKIKYFQSRSSHAICLCMPLFNS